MSDGKIDRIPVNQLVQRYKLARSAVYKRMSDLGIEREKIGNRAYVNAEQIALLDELHAFIQIGGNIAEFIARRGLSPGKSSDDGSGQAFEGAAGAAGGLSFSQPDMLKLLNAFAAEMAAQIRPADPLAYYESLEKAASRKWKLRTSELADLLNLDPEEIESYGQTFFEAGFAFNRAGFRSGGEAGWFVSKDLRNQ